jgi:hypothetical protein
MKLGWEGMNSYLTRLLEISINNITIPRDWKLATVVLIYKGVYRSALSNHRPVSLSSVVCKQQEQVITGYLGHVWEKNDWLYEGQHEFRAKYSCESQAITVCRDIADSL